MSKKSRMALAIACALVVATGCKKDLASTDRSRFNTLETTGSIAQKPSPELLAKIRAFNASFKAKYPNGLQTLAAPGPEHNSELQEMARIALAVKPTPCDANTTVSLWLDNQLADWDRDVMDFALNTAMLDLPTYYTLYLENSSENQVFGVNGAFTQVLQKTFKDEKRFWNINGDRIALVAMSGSLLRDKERLKLAYGVVYGLDADEAEFYAGLVSEAAVAVPQFRNGDHPIFTFNAVAMRGFRHPVLGAIPDKVAMGDGILQAYQELGYADVAPQAIFAHEFGHHVQYQLNLFPRTRTPEGTRRTELMADAYSTYFLSHARGASMQWKRVQMFYDVFYNIGDCNFTATGHHGTPLQRLRASQWAYGIADGAQKQGHILTSQQFTALFEQQLPELVK